MRLDKICDGVEWICNGVESTEVKRNGKARYRQALSTEAEMYVVSRGDTER